MLVIALRHWSISFTIAFALPYFVPICNQLTVVRSSSIDQPATVLLVGPVVVTTIYNIVVDRLLQRWCFVNGYDPDIMDYKSHQIT
jgi:hypothetical protein